MGPKGFPQAITIWYEKTVEKFIPKKYRVLALEKLKKNSSEIKSLVTTDSARKTVEVLTEDLCDILHEAKKGLLKQYEIIYNQVK